MITYTTIIHSALLDLDVTPAEYVFLDIVYHLSQSDEYGRWCIIGAPRIGHHLKLSRSGAYKMQKRLIEMGLLKVHPETGHMRTTEKFYHAAVIAKKHLDLTNKIKHETGPGAQE